MKRHLNINLIFAVIGLNLLIFSFNNCGAPTHGAGSSDFVNLQVDTTSGAAEAAIQILNSNCASCHGQGGVGGVMDITDLNHLVQIGLVIPGNSSGSPLMQAVQNGIMPPNGPLTSTEQTVLENWITNALDTTLSPSPTPSPAPSPVPSPAPAPSPSPSGPPVVSETFSAMSTNILIPHCVSCHGPTAAGNGYRFDSYTGVLAAVVAGNLSASLLYTQVASGTMPQGGPILSTADLEAIAQWIQNGALNN